MMDQTSILTTDYVGVIPGCSLVYVIVADRKKFDDIKGPVTDHSQHKDGRRVLTKSTGNLDSAECMVTFQYWLPADEADTPEVKGAVQWNG
jgi:hypothetical protein